MSPLPGFDPRIVRPLATTNNATPARKKKDEKVVKISVEEKENDKAI
jgi:hypothetical protein